MEPMVVDWRLTRLVDRDCGTLMERRRSRTEDGSPRIIPVGEAEEGEVLFEPLVLELPILVLLALEDGGWHIRVSRYRYGLIQYEAMGRANRMDEALVGSGNRSQAAQKRLRAKKSAQDVLDSSNRNDMPTNSSETTLLRRGR